MNETSSTAIARHLLHREFEVMGTVVTIDLYGGADLDETPLARSVDAAEKLLRKADETFSLWKPQSPMSRLRDGELRLEKLRP